MKVPLKNLPQDCQPALADTPKRIQRRPSHKRVNSLCSEELAQLVDSTPTKPSSPSRADKNRFPFFPSSQSLDTESTKARAAIKKMQRKSFSIGQEQKIDDEKETTVIIESLELPPQVTLRKHSGRKSEKGSDSKRDIFSDKLGSYVHLSRLSPFEPELLTIINEQTEHTASLATSLKRRSLRESEFNNFGLKEVSNLDSLSYNSSDQKEKETGDELQNKNQQRAIYPLQISRQKSRHTNKNNNFNSFSENTSSVLKTKVCQKGMQIIGSGSKTRNDAAINWLRKRPLPNNPTPHFQNRTFAHTNVVQVSLQKTQINEKKIINRGDTSKSGTKDKTRFFEIKAPIENLLEKAKNSFPIKAQNYKSSKKYSLATNVIPKSTKSRKVAPFDTKINYKSAINSPDALSFPFRTPKEYKSTLETDQTKTDVDIQPFKFSSITKTNTFLQDDKEEFKKSILSNRRTASQYPEKPSLQSRESRKEETQQITQKSDIKSKINKKEKSDRSLYKNISTLLIETENKITRSLTTKQNEYANLYVQNDFVPPQLLFPQTSLEKSDRIATDTSMKFDNSTCDFAKKARFSKKNLPGNETSGDEKQSGARLFTDANTPTQSMIIYHSTQPGTEDSLQFQLQNTRLSIVKNKEARVRKVNSRKRLPTYNSLSKQIIRKTQSLNLFGELKAEQSTGTQITPLVTHSDLQKQIDVFKKIPEGRQSVLRSVVQAHEIILSRLQQKVTLLECKLRGSMKKTSQITEKNKNFAVKMGKFSSEVTQQRIKFKKEVTTGFQKPKVSYTSSGKLATITDSILPRPTIQNRYRKSFLKEVQ